MKEPLKAGDRVHYTTHHGAIENGIVKSIGGMNTVFVVYRCNDDWDHYAEYTGSRTPLEDLSLGWAEQKNPHPFTEEDLAGDIW